MADEDIDLGIEADLDEQSVIRAAERMGDIFGAVIGRGGSEAGRAFATSFDRAFRSSDLGKNAFGNIEREAQKATQAVRTVGEASARVADALENVRTVGASSSRALSERFKAIDADITSLNAQSEAWRSTLRSVGADQNLLSGIDRQLNVLRSTARDLEDDLRRGVTIDPQRFEQISASMENLNKTMFREVAVFQTLMRNMNDAQRVEGDRTTREADRQAQERLLIQKGANSRFVVETQGAEARLLAADRSAGRERLAEQQANARRRIEILRFTFRQIQTIERGIAGVFRATGTVATSAFRALSAASNRIGNLFRRTNRDLNDGLGAALNQRERSIARSFGRQTREIQAETTRQARAIEKLERQASTGVLGALTGRSRLGGAVGAGALIGGGFTSANLFSAGLDRFQSLERANLQLERILGSATAARRQLDSLNEWAQGTPLALDLVTEIAVGLLSMGTAADQVLPRLEAITDVVAFAGGGSEEIRRVSLAIRQVASAGRLLGQDFNQIAQALPGVNLAKLLADELTGGDTAELLKLRESGEISANEFITAFVAGIQNDPRIGGSTASLSATLSGQISNLNAAWRRLGAAIITEFEGPIRAAIKRLRDNLSLLARFIAGDVSPAFQALRSAIAGVAIALGILVAARTAVQIIQLLGVAAQFALTPMGALVTAFVAIGAAVGALRSTSDTFRFITDGIRDLASDSLSRGLSLLVEALRRLGGFLAETVAPAIANLARTVFPALIFAVRVLVAVVRAVLIPAVQAGFGFFVDTAIPAALRLADALSQYLLPAVLALGAAWFVLNAPLGVVVVAVTALATALIILRRESLSVRDFTDSLGESFLNLGRKLASIGSAAGSAALTVLSALGETLSTLFSRIDYQALAVDILRFVNEVGRLLGRAITSRVAVTAGIAIGVAAVALAGSFLVGFAEGVITGLPVAIDTILDAIRLGLSELGAPSFFTSLFKNSFTGIAAVLAAAFVASSVLRAVTTSGGRVAGAFSAGLAPGIRNGFTNAFRGIQALAGPERALRAAGARNAAAYQSEFDRVVRNNSRLGFQSQLISGGSVSRSNADAAAVRRLTAEQERYIASTGRSVASAALFRRTWGEVLTSTGNRWQALQDRVAQTGGWGAVGQRAGIALVTSFAAVLAGSQGGTQGLVGVVTASLGALAIGGPVVAGITAIAGGAALLYANLRDSNAAAELLAETTERIRDALRDSDDATGTLVESIRTAVEEAIGGSGGQALTLLPDGFFTSTAKQIEDGSFEIDGAFASIAANLGLTTRQIQDLLALNESGISDFATSLGSNATNIEDALFDLFAVDPLQTITPELERQAAAVLALTAALEEAGVPGSQVAEILGAIGIQADATTAAVRDLEEETRLLREGLSPIDAGFFADIEARAVATSEEVTGLSRLLQFEGVANAVGRVTGLIDRVGDVGVDAFEAIQQELAGTGITLDNELTGFIRDLINQWIRSGLEGDRALRLMKIDQGFFADMEAMGGTARNLGEAFDDMGEEAADAAQEVDLIGAAFRELETQRSTKIRAQITAIQDQLEAAEGAAERARDALTAFITGRYADTAGAQVDALIGNISSIGSAIEDALLQGGVRGDAALRSAVGGFESQLAGIIQAGFDDGLRTQEQFRTLLAPLFAAVDEEAGDAAGRILSTVDFTEGITPEAGREIAAALQRAVGGNNLEVAAGAIMNAESEVERLQAQLDAAQASLEVDVAFSGDQVRKALEAAFDEAGITDPAVRNRLLGQATDTAVAAGQQSALAQTVTQASSTTTYTDESTTTIIVDGSKSPTETGIEIVRKQQQAKAGRFTPVPV
jgi:tape measure domain-containing protein